MSNRIGIVVVAAIAGIIGAFAPPVATITATSRRTSSAAIVGSRSYSPSAQRKSIATFWPSTNSIAFRPSRNAATRWAHGAGEALLDEPNDRHRRWLLCARRERPRRCRAAEQRDELAPYHSITSSASASNVGGTSSPRECAVLRLITNSNLVGCTTGSSAGFAPLRTRPT